MNKLVARAGLAKSKAKINFVRRENCHLIDSHVRLIILTLDISSRTVC